MASSTYNYSHSAFPLMWKDLVREPSLYCRELEKRWMINRASLTLTIKPGLDCMYRLTPLLSSLVQITPTKERNIMYL